MIKSHFTFAFLFLMAGAVLLTSCSSDSSSSSDNGTLDIPAYKSVSAIYQVTQTSSQYSSIEFTESGNYIITKKSSASAPARRSNAEINSIISAPWSTDITRSTSYGNIITGKYTTNGNKYTLEGFGTITVVTSGDTAVSLEIAENGGSSYTLTAAKKTQEAGSEKTTKLCRSWKIASLGLETSMKIQDPNGKQQSYSFNKTVNGGNLPELMYLFYADMMVWAANISSQNGEKITQEMIEEQLKSQKEKIQRQYKTVETCLFSQAGTYMVTYGDNSLAVATWAWKNSSQDVLQYSWNYANMNSSGVSGSCDISFKGSKCILVENASGSDGSIQDMNMIMTYTLEEIK